MQLPCCSLHILLRNITYYLIFVKLKGKKKNKETLAKQNALITSFEKKKLKDRYFAMIFDRNFKPFG